MTEIMTKGLIGEQDIRHYSGDETVFTRPSSTGGTVQLNVVGYEVDALVSFGSGQTYSSSTIDKALAAIGTSQKATLVLRPGTWVISENVDWSAYTNVTLKCPPGATISHGAYTISWGGQINAGLYPIFSGAGAITLSKVTEIPPQWFGAAGDGSTDDSNAWLYAIVALSNGGTIDGNGKTYLINTQKLSVDVDNLFIRNCTLKRTSTTTGWMLAWAQSADTEGGGLQDVTLIGNPLSITANAGSCGVLFGYSNTDNSIHYDADKFTAENVTVSSFSQYGFGIKNGSHWSVNNVRVLEHGLTSGTLTYCIGFYVYPQTASDGGILSNIYAEMSADAVANGSLNAAAMKLQAHQNLVATNLTAIYGSEETLSIDSVQGIISNVTVIPQGNNAGLVVGNYNIAHSFSGQTFILDGVRIQGDGAYGFVIGGGDDGQTKLTGCIIRNMSGMFARTLNYSNFKQCTFENWTFEDIRLSTTNLSQSVNSIASTANTFRNIVATGGTGQGNLALETDDSTIINCGVCGIDTDKGYLFHIYGSDNQIINPYCVKSIYGIKITGDSNELFYPSFIGLNSAGRSIQLPSGSDSNVIHGGNIWDGDGILDNGTGNVILSQNHQPNVTAKTTAITLTIAELLTRIITATHTAGATQAYTLPTGTDADTGTGSIGVDGSFDWTLINLSAAAADTITLTANTAHTIVGNPIVQSAHATTGGLYGNSAAFRTRKTAADTFVTYRIA